MAGGDHAVTLEAMIRSHDAQALETLASRGLLRRAQRDLASGKGELISLEPGEAGVAVDEYTVTLDAKGPLSSSCTCRAHGLCRHILLAILLLREHFAKSAGDEDKPASSALTEVCAIADEDIARYAGADWGKALGLIADGLELVFEDEGINVTVRMTELNAQVTFIAGNGLKGAAYKGPKTRKRLLVTAAALLLRQREGVLPAGMPGASAPARGIAAEFIDHAQETIGRAVSATLPSRSALAHDLLLDLAISSRCEALPRLSAELRMLAGQTQLASERSVEFEPEAFLMDAARSYALLEVLRAVPGNPLLTGSVRQDYRKSDGMTVWPLGVSRWRSGTGARGLSAYVLNPQENRWFTVLEGRGAGMDPAFDPANAYHMPVWGAGTLRGLIGREVRLPQPSLSRDGLLSTKPQDGSDASKGYLKLDEVLGCSAAHGNWSALRQDLRQRMGSGVCRRPVPIPALIAPSGFGRIGFDDLNQAYDWELHDDAGEPLLLRIPAEDEESALRVWRLGKKIAAMVVEARLHRQELEVRPVSILQRRQSGVAVHNVDFDDWPVETKLDRLVSNLKTSVSRPLVPVRRDGAVAEVISEAVAELAGVLADGSSAKVDPVVRRAEACGLTTLAESLRAASAGTGTQPILKAAYIASEAMALAALEAEFVVRSGEHRLSN